MAVPIVRDVELSHPAVFLDRGSDAGARFNDLNSQVVTGDFTGDGRGDVLVYCEWQSRAFVWGVEQTVRGWREMATFDIEFRNTQSKLAPILRPSLCNDSRP